jgi:hypothetical protein
MTAFGKLLVFLNLAFSFFLMSWAMAVYTNRIDFSNTKGTGEQAAGEFFKRAAVVENLWEGVRPAQVNWRNARAAIADKDAHQVTEWAFYHVEIDHNRSKAVAANPVRWVVFAEADDDRLGIKKGQVALDPKTLLPLMAPAKDRNGNPMPALAFLNIDLEKTMASIDQVQEKHEKQIKEAIALTEQLIGPKGLQQRLIDEKQKRKDVLDEEKLVRPLLINTVVESELILKRHNQLVRRIDELKRIGVAARDR